MKNSDKQSVVWSEVRGSEPVWMEAGVVIVVTQLMDHSLFHSCQNSTWSSQIHQEGSYALMASPSVHTL